MNVERLLVLLEFFIVDTFVRSTKAIAGLASEVVVGGSWLPLLLHEPRTAHLAHITACVMLASEKKTDR